MPSLGRLYFHIAAPMSKNKSSAATGVRSPERETEPTEELNGTCDVDKIGWQADGLEGFDESRAVSKELWIAVINEDQGQSASAAGAVRGALVVLRGAWSFPLAGSVCEWGTERDSNRLRLGPVSRTKQVSGEFYVNENPFR